MAARVLSSESGSQVRVGVERGLGRGVTESRLHYLHVGSRCTIRRSGPSTPDYSTHSSKSRRTTSHRWEFGLSLSSRAPSAEAQEYRVARRPSETSVQPGHWHRVHRDPPDPPHPGHPSV